MGGTEITRLFENLLELNALNLPTSFLVRSDHVSLHSVYGVARANSVVLGIIELNVVGELTCFKVHIKYNYDYIRFHIPC